MGQIIDITTGNPLDDERSNKPNMPICVEDAEFEYLDDEERDLIEAIESEGDWRQPKICTRKSNASSLWHKRPAPMTSVAARFYRSPRADSGSVEHKTNPNGAIEPFRRVSALLS